MKKILQYIIVLAFAVFLTACGNKLSNGTYVSEDGNYTMVVEDKQVEFDFGLAQAEGTIEKDKIKVEVTALLVLQEERVYTYKMKGGKVEVTDDMGKVTVFEKQKDKQ